MSSRKRNKNSNKNVLISSVVPIILLFLIGNAINNGLNKKENETDTNELKVNIISKNEVTNTTNSTNTSDLSNLPTTSKNKVVFDETVAFIGDSRTQGLIMYTGLSKVQDYSYIGLMVDTAITKEFVKTSDGEKITLLQDMKDKNIKKVYIMLGTNELGWSYPSVFKLKYEELIDEIRKVKPNCEIYVQSIIPVTEKKDKSDKIFNNTNITKFNKLIKEVSNEKNVKYLDVQSVLSDSRGYLPSNESTDGIHIEQNGCKKWLEFLQLNS